MGVRPQRATIPTYAMRKQVSCAAEHFGRSRSSRAGRLMMRANGRQYHSPFHERGLIAHAEARHRLRTPHIITTKPVKAACHADADSKYARLEGRHASTSRTYISYLASPPHPLSAPPPRFPAFAETDMLLMLYTGSQHFKESREHSSLYGLIRPRMKESTHAILPRHIFARAAHQDAKGCVYRPVMPYRKYKNTTASRHY